MPFTIKKVGDVYKLYNTDKKVFAKKSFKTKQSAINMRKNYMRYDKIKK